jgi:hypothetical protein
METDSYAGSLLMLSDITPKIRHFSLIPIGLRPS